MPRLYRFGIGIECCRRFAVAMENTKRIAVNEPGGCGRKSDHTGVKILHDFVQAVKDGAMRLIKNDEIEEARTELFVTARDCLKRGNVETFGLVYVVGINPVTGLVWQKGMEAVRSEEHTSELQ